MVDLLVDSLLGPPYLLESVLRGDEAVPSVSIDQGVQGDRLVVDDVCQCPRTHCAG